MYMLYTRMYRYRYVLENIDMLEIRYVAIFNIAQIKYGVPTVQ